MIPPKTETFDVKKKETNLQPKPIILLKKENQFSGQLKN